MIKEEENFSMGSILLLYEMTVIRKSFRPENTSLLEAAMNLLL